MPIFAGTTELSKRALQRGYKCLNCGFELAFEETEPRNRYTRRFCSEACRQTYLKH